MVFGVAGHGPEEEHAMISDASAVERPRRREEGREGREHGEGACLVRGLPEHVLSPTTWPSVLSHVSLFDSASLLGRVRLRPLELGHIVLDLVRGLTAPVLPTTTWPSALGQVSLFDHAPLLAWPCAFAPLPDRAPGPSGPCAPGPWGESRGTEFAQVHEWVVAADRFRYPSHRPQTARAG